MGITDITFEPISSRLALASSGGTVQIWNFADKTLLITLNDFTSSVSDVALNADGSTVVAAYLDGSIIVWDTATGEKQLSLPGISTAYTTSLSVDERLLAYGGWDSTNRRSTLRVWDYHEQQEIATLEFDVTETERNGIVDLQFSPTADALVFSNVDTSDPQNAFVGLWDKRSPKKIFVLYRDNAQGISFSADGREFAFVTSDQVHETVIAHVWAVEERRVIADIPVEDASFAYHAELNPNGDMIAISTLRPPTMRVFDVQTRSEALQLTAQRNFLATDMVFNSDGSLLVAATGISAPTEDEIDGLVVWDIGTGTQLTTLEGHLASVLAVEISLDNRVIVSGSEDGTIRLWGIPECK